MEKKKETDKVKLSAFPEKMDKDGEEMAEHMEYMYNLKSSI